MFKSNRYKDPMDTPFGFKLFFGFIIGFIIIVFVAIITFYVMADKYVYSGKAKKDINSEVRDISKSWHDRD